MRLLSLTVAIALALGGRAWAMGDADRFDVASLTLGSPDGEIGSAIDRLAWELENRTSLRVAARAPTVQATDPQLRRHPLLFLRGTDGLPPLDEKSLDALRGHLEAGGTLYIDAAATERSLDDDPFDRDVRELVRRLFPRAALEPIARDHVLWKTYYLLNGPAGRRARAPQVEGVSIDGRLAIIYSRNDAIGALARDRLGAFAHAVEPGGEAQRERATRFLINVVMYGLCLDYKADQVHTHFLLERHRSMP